MKAYTRRRLAASAKLGLASMAYMIVVTLTKGEELQPGTFILGFGLGFTVGIAELFVLRNWLRRSPFFLHIAVKSLAIVMVMYATFAALDILDVVIEGKTWAAYFNQLYSRELLSGILQFFGVVVFLIFFVHLDRLLGPGVLLGYVTGRYHRPRREKRIFMFLDLKGSTALADEMDAETYFKFLNRYFTEMSDPILESDAEIYQYVGDEIVLTWQMKAGLEEAACVRVYFLILDQIQAHREQYLADFGTIPQFKAGIHAGEVISAQIGELKSEIVYNGDVLNTTARIQALCNELGQALLISRRLLEELNLGPEYSVQNLGPVSLRGKGEALELCGIRRVLE